MSIILFGLFLRQTKNKHFKGVKKRWLFFVLAGLINLILILLNNSFKK